MEKLHQLLLLLENFWGYVLRKFDQVLPPETRSETLNHWLSVGLAVAIPLSLLFCCLYCCCRCCRSSGGRVRMMKTPGRNGLRMPRAPFEANPRTYFRGLRAGQPLREYVVSPVTSYQLVCVSCMFTTKMKVDFCVSFVWIRRWFDSDYSLLFGVWIFGKRDEEIFISLTRQGFTK